MSDEEIRDALRVLLAAWEQGGQEAVEKIINHRPTSGKE